MCLDAYNDISKQFLLNIGESCGYKLKKWQKLQKKAPNIGKMRPLLNFS